MLWPKQIKDPELRAKLFINEYLDEMSKIKLRNQLEKRGIEQYVKDKSWIGKKDEAFIKKVAIARLKEYLNNNECSQVYNLLVIGYCKRMEKSEKFNFAMYLKKIVLKYYPAYLLKNA